MSYSPSVNIESGISKDFQYVVTPNAQAVTGQLINNFKSGNHAVTVIGTYGTGKSSYLMALERDLRGETDVLIRIKDIFVENCTDYEFLNILGDVDSLAHLLGEKIGCSDCDNTRNVISALKHYYQTLDKAGKMLVIVVDEFGKVLEHAAKNDPDKELYFLQQLAEFCNARNVLFLTTLHQNFGAYAARLNDSQRQEWNKVKGRFKDVVFSEPIEQLLYMASKKLGVRDIIIHHKEEFLKMLEMAQRAKFVSNSLTSEIALNLYPLDPLAANCLTQAIQRYGQNERTLFQFLTAQGPHSLNDFETDGSVTYNLASVYDYITYSFFSALNEANADSMNWRAMKEAISRVESGILSEEMTDDAVRLVKAIGLLNLFGGSGVSIEEDMLTFYAEYALGIHEPKEVIEKLIWFKVIRYAVYKKQYILFEGTDIDIENQLVIAETKVAKPSASVQELSEYIEARVAAAVAEYYKKGTPRYFEYITENEPTIIQPKDDVDGTIQLEFPLEGMTIDHVKEVSASNHHANVYVYFNNVDVIVKHLHQIKKLNFLLESVVMDDFVARREVRNLLNYERIQLNEAVNASIVAGDENVTWIFRGEEIKVDSQGALKKLLSSICEQVYFKTPILRNELFNKQKINSAISLARVNLLNALLENSTKADLGFSASAFPPEKTIYYSLIKDTGIHRQVEEGSLEYVLGAPTQGILSIWEASENFLKSSLEKPRKIGELIKILKEAPYKLKQGVLDFWIPLFLFVKQQDFALYTPEGTFVMRITKEVFELLQKQPKEYSVKAFEMEGIKMEYFHQYRKLLRNTSLDDALSANTFIQTIKPFLGFYRGLNEYAKSTRKFDHPETARFRDVLANAKDPEKAFFVDLPDALNLKSEDMLKGDELTKRVQTSMRELQSCYGQLVDRIEATMIEMLALDSEFSKYKEQLVRRYQNVHANLLTPKSRTFLDRLNTPSSNKQEFIERICNAVIDKRLEQLKDREEDQMMNNLLYHFRELDRHIEIAKELDKELFETNDQIFNFELVSNQGDQRPSQTYRLPAGQMKKAESIEQKLLQSLSGDDNLDVCVLLRLLNEKMGKK